jgi:hypothetical protein
MTQKTDRITGTDGKLYDHTYDPCISMTPVVEEGGGGETGGEGETEQTGLITDFNAQNSATFNINGAPVYNHNANKIHSLRNPDKYTLRFEVQSGDCWSVPGWDDATQNNGVERSEIQFGTNFGPGQRSSLGYKFTLEPGADNSADWLLITQIHQTPQEGPPPFAIELVGERLRVMIRNDDERDGIATDGGPIVRGEVYDIWSELQFDPDGNGICNVWCNGEQIVNYTGKLGYASQEYFWKLGCYREASREVIAVTFRNINRA